MLLIYRKNVLQPSSHASNDTNLHILFQILIKSQDSTYQGSKLYTFISIHFRSFSIIHSLVNEIVVDN